MKKIELNKGVNILLMTSYRNNIKVLLNQDVINKTYRQTHKHY